MPECQIIGRPNGRAGNDHISVADSASALVVSGLAAQVTIDGAEAGNDAVAASTG
jgi:hypothetical protein